ncbi:MAG: hypothetical protein WAL83_08475, partial [Arenicellales bacterium]
MDAASWCAGLAVALALVSSAVSMLAGTYPRLMRLLVMPLFSASGSAAVAAGLTALWHGGVATATLPLGLPWLPWRVRIDT